MHNSLIMSQKLISMGLSSACGDLESKEHASRSKVPGI